MPVIVFSNYFYGSLYFVVTVGVSCGCTAGTPTTTRCGATPWPIGTLLGLIGFATFPLMPPRLLAATADYGFVDTLVKYPTFWSFDSGRR